MQTLPPGQYHVASLVHVHFNSLIIAAFLFGLLLVFWLWSESLFTLPLFNISLFTFSSLHSIFYNLLTGFWATGFVLATFTCAPLTWLSCPLINLSTLPKLQLDPGIFPSFIPILAPIWILGCSPFVVAGLWFLFNSKCISSTIFPKSATINYQVSLEWLVLLV